MSRFILALRCFLAVLLRNPLPPQAAALLLPLGARGPSPSLPPVEPEPVKVVERVVEKVVEKIVEVPAPSASTSGVPVHRGAVQLLAVLQREGRLLDFLMEDIDSYADAQIGAAVRDIHRGCRKALGEHLKLRPIRTEPDEAVVRIPEGYDPSRIRLVGRVTGRPPFEGTLRHHGWCTGDINLSDIPAGHDPTVICPAEVELGA
jgi:hypothetical protein